MRIKSLVAALVLCLSGLATPVGAAPLDGENPCDPEHGSYICDGTEDQPINDRPSKAKEDPCDPEHGSYICDGTEDQPIKDRPKQGRKLSLPATGV